RTLRITLAVVTIANVTDLAHVLPLTGRRTMGRVALATPVAFVAAGIAFAVIAGRHSAGTAFLSLGIPGPGQLVQSHVAAGVALLVLLLPALIYAIMRSGGYTLLILASVAGLDAAVGGRWWSVPAGLGIALVI